MPTPLQWNARRDWTFDVDLSGSSIILLRDHITLITDMAKDWTSGNTGDFHHFVPCDYQFRINLSDYSLKLYVNDFNIVDSPNRNDANCFLEVFGTETRAEMELPLIRFRPESSTIPFSVQGSGLRLHMHMPIWHTQNAFGTTRTAELGKVDKLHLRGSYLFYAEPSPDHVESLTLFIYLDGVAFRVIGWAIRRLMLIKENYAGAFLNFQTTQDFHKEFSKTPRKWGDRSLERYRPGKSDVLETNLELEITNGRALLPCELYDSVEAMVLPVPKVELHLRSHEAFMELSIHAQPTSLFHAGDSGVHFEDCYSDMDNVTRALHFEGISIRANRLFGRPPHTATYLCLWEFHLPAIGGSCDATLLRAFDTGLSVFMFGFNDPDNAPLPLYMPPATTDVTIYKLSMPRADVTYWSDLDALNLRAFDLTLDSNDRASTQYASLLSVTLETIHLSVLQGQRTNTNQTQFLQLATIRTGLNLDLFKAPPGWQDKARAQQEFLRLEDAATHRVSPMYKDDKADSGVYHVGPLFLPQPFVEDSEADDSLSESSDSSQSSGSTEFYQQGRTVDQPNRAARALRNKDRLRALHDPSGTNESGWDSDSSADLSSHKCANGVSDSDGCSPDNRPRMRNPSVLEKIVPVFAFNPERAEQSFVEQRRPVIGALRQKPLPEHQLPSSKQNASDENVTPAQDRSHSVMSIVFSQEIDLFFTPNCLEPLKRCQSSFQRDMARDEHDAFRSWLDQCMMTRWKSLKNQFAAKDRNIKVYNISAPSLKVRSAIANRDFAPLLGIPRGEGSDFDVVVVEARVVEPAFSRIETQQAGVEFRMDQRSTNNVTWSGLEIDSDVKDSTSSSPYAEIALRRQGQGLVNVTSGQSSVRSMTGASENTVEVDLSSLHGTIATNALPAIISFSTHWSQAILNLGSDERPSDSQAKMLKMARKLTLLAEEMRIDGEPAFMGLTGPLLQPPDNWGDAEEATGKATLTLRQDLGWRVLSQLRYYFRDVLGTHRHELTLTADDQQVDLDKVDHGLHEHFAQWRQWEFDSAAWNSVAVLHHTTADPPKKDVQDQASPEHCDHKLEIAISRVQFSIFDIKAIEGHRLATLESCGLNFTSCRLVRPQLAQQTGHDLHTLRLAGDDVGLAVHLDILFEIEPLYHAIRSQLESHKKSGPAKKPQGNTDANSQSLLLSFGRMGLRVNGEPLQFALESHDTHVIATKHQTVQQMRIINVLCQTIVVSVSDLTEAHTNALVKLPRIFEVKFRGVESSFQIAQLDSTTSSQLSSSLTLLIQTVDVLTSYDPRRTESVIHEWKVRRFL